MADHARLSPSSAERWMTCPGSVSLSAGVVDSGSRAAAEGTACHKMLEAWAKKGIPPRTWSGRSITVVEGEGPSSVVTVVEVTSEMVLWVEEAVEWIESYLRGHPGAHLMSEEKLHVGRAFGCPDDLWGTGDILIEAGEELVVFDLKAGYIDVQVVGNRQLTLYAIGAMAEYGWAHEQVRIVVFQPRSGGAKEDVLTRAEVEDARKRYAPKVRAALQPGGALVPSDDGCQWCPAAGVCPALQSENLALAQQEFSDPATGLRRNEFLQILKHSARIKSALAAAERHAVKLLQSGVKLEGFKVVAADKRESWKDEDVALEHFIVEEGLEPDEVAPRSLITPNQVAAVLASKMTGHPTKKAALSHAKGLVSFYSQRLKGEPTLVAEDDPRPALPPEFKEET
jgi:hypothetical protein